MNFSRTLLLGITRYVASHDTIVTEDVGDLEEVVANFKINHPSNCLTGDKKKGLFGYLISDSGLEHGASRNTNQCTTTFDTRNYLLQKINDQRLLFTSMRLRWGKPAHHKFYSRWSTHNIRFPFFWVRYRVVASWLRSVIISLYYHYHKQTQLDKYTWSK
jgi:hypothetical protein